MEKSRKFIDAVKGLAYIVVMKTAAIRTNGYYAENEQPRFVVIFEEKSGGVQIELKVKHYANRKTAERAAAKYLGAA